MCILCRTRAPRDACDFCEPCSLVARLEVARGLRRLEEYLAAHALFRAWDERMTDH
jgi:hypothetical protein